MFPTVPGRERTTKDVSPFISIDPVVGWIRSWRQSFENLATFSHDRVFDKPPICFACVCKGFPHVVVDVEEPFAAPGFWQLYG